jgi:hypothetical protein
VEPKTVWLEPPKAAPMPAPLPCCRSTIETRRRYDHMNDNDDGMYTTYNTENPPGCKPFCLRARRRPNPDIIGSNFPASCCSFKMAICSTNGMRNCFREALLPRQWTSRSAPHQKL